MEKRFTNIENKFKSKLADHEDWHGGEAEMWGAIEGALDEKKRRKVFIWWFFGGMMCLGLLGVGLWSMNVQQVGMEGELTTKAKIETIVANIESFDNQADINQLESKTLTSKEENNINNQIPKTNITTKSTPKSLQDDIQKPAKSEIGLNTPKSVNAFNSTPVSTASSTLPIASNAKSFFGTSKSSEDGVFQLTDFLDQRMESLEYSDTLETPCVVVNVIEEKEMKEKSSRLSIGYFRGINHHTNGFHFTNAANALRKATEKGQFGTEEGLTVEYRLNNDFLLATGIGMSKYWERFDYNNETAISTFEDNVVVRYHVNINSMDTTFIIGDRFLNGVEERDIRHHNSWSMVRVPLLFGKQWTNNRSTFKLLGGLSFEKRIAQETKDSTNDFQIYTQSAQSPTFRKFGMNIEVMPAYDFRITPRFTATIALPIRYALTSWDYRDRADLSFAQKRPLIYSLNIGLKYEW